MVAFNTVSVYLNALDAADQAYDRSLLASTRALAERVSIKQGQVVVDVPYVALDSFETDNLGRIYYKVSGTQGEFISGYRDLPIVPESIPRSESYPALVRFYHSEYKGQAIRIAALLQPVFDDSMQGIALIQVAETLDARRDLTHKILIDTLWRQAALLIALAALIWFAVGLVLRPLMRLKTEVETRSLADLSHVDPSMVHKEVRPLVLAMNENMARTHKLIASQRRFIADASHQLRTPLTILKTQAELGLREHKPEQLHTYVQSMAVTVDSAINLANRLLTLARIEHGGEANLMSPINLASLAHHVSLEMAPAAIRKNIDLSLETLAQMVVMGQEVMLHELLTNLVDNAIHYTPDNGKIAISVNENEEGVCLEVEDSGCGISENEYEKVLTPFYRANSSLDSNPSGTGLGLSIVQDIALLHQAHLKLSPARSGQGLCVQVIFQKSQFTLAPEYMSNS
jgi:two-component system sensor histidine kinase TctE